MGQGQGAVSADPGLAAEEQRLSVQVESVMLPVKWATGIFSGLAIVLTVFGLGSYPLAPTAT